MQRMEKSRGAKLGLKQSSLDIEKKICAYYDGLADEQVKEDAAWGDFAFAQIASHPVEKNKRRLIG
jgi:hypothetical protein